MLGAFLSGAHDGRPRDFRTAESAPDLRPRIPGRGADDHSDAWAKRTLVDGPFAETKELIAGYTLIQVKSREEAIEWTKRFPNSAIDGKKGEIEVRQLFELEDFGPSEAIERFREMGVGRKE